MTIFQLFSSGGHEGPLLHIAVRQCTAILQLLSGEGVWWTPPPLTDVPPGVSLGEDLDLLGQLILTPLGIMRFLDWNPGILVE